MYDPANFILTTIPQRADLRKLGVMPKSTDQGTCGSCYIHASRNVFYSQFFRDLPYYLNQSKLVSLWNLTTSTASFSIQYIMNRTFGSN